ncbi:MAG: MFS transporter [Candidatus Nanopelagicales bacterium]
MPNGQIETRLEAADRRIVLGVALATAGSLFCISSKNFVIPTIVSSLDASEAESMLLRQLPGVGALLAIFVVGALIMRIGPQRCIMGAGVFMIVGYLGTFLAPNITTVMFGLTLAFIGKAAAIVATVSLLSSSLRDKNSRATGFATLAMVGPAVYLAVPIMASFVVQSFGWRWVSVIWLLGGCLVIVSALKVLPSTGPATPQRGEIWTPILAGVVLVGLTQILRLGANDGFATTPMVVALGVTALGAGTLVLLLRKLSLPSMSFSLLRNGSLVMMLVVGILIGFANVTFYGVLGAQYVYGMTPFHVSLLFIPVQLAGVVGAKYSGRLVKTRGLTFTGVLSLLVCAAACFLCWFQTVTISIVFPLLLLIVFGACAAGAGGTISNAIMSLAPTGDEGPTSAFRSAAVSLGASMGTVFLSAVVFSTMAASMSNANLSTGLTLDKATNIAKAVIQGANSEDVAAQYRVPVALVNQETADERQAGVEGFRAQGLGGGVMLLSAAGLFYLARRRVERNEAAIERRETEPA